MNSSEIVCIFCWYRFIEAPICLVHYYNIVAILMDDHLDAKKMDFEQKYIVCKQLILFS